MVRKYVCMYVRDVYACMYVQYIGMCVCMHVRDTCMGGRWWSMFIQLNKE